MPNTTNSKHPPLFTDDDGKSLATKPTRSETTKLNYAIQYAELLRILPDFGIEHQLCHPPVKADIWVANLLWYKEFRGESTFRQYKAVIKFYLAEIEGRDDDVKKIDSLLELPSEAVKLYQSVIQAHTKDGQIINEKRSRGRPPKSQNDEFEEFDTRVNYEDAVREIEKIKKTPQQVLNNGKPVGPAAKNKEVEKHHCEQMLAYLNKEDRKPGTVKELCFLMVLCGIAFGLRPSEWANARLTNQGLLVINGKNSNGRANGDTRLIPTDYEQMYSFLQNMFPHAKKQILELCAETYFQEIRYTQPLLPKLIALIDLVCHPTDIRDDPATISKRKEALNNRTKHNSRVFDGFEPRISLYSARHQFAANVKNFIDQFGVADLMGHASSQTADRNYARRTKGSDALKNLAHQIKFEKKLTISKKGQATSNNSNDQQSDWSFPQP